MTLLDIYFTRNLRSKTSVAVLGFNPTGIKLASYFEKQSPHFTFKGILDESDTLFVNEAGELHSRLRAGIKLAQKRDVKEVYAAIPPEMMPNARILLREAEESFVRLKLVPDLSSAMAARYQITYMDDFPVITLRHEPLEGLNNRFKKRLFDLVFSTLVIVFLLSWLYPIIALLIKYQSPGPVLFKQLRSGRDNKPFFCYKFRSMKVNKDSDTKQASKDDDRITRIGKILRKTSLDELPQFFNVFKGEMSVVGPRPHMLSHTEQYRAIIDQFMVRHFLKPGITGWAQVTGFRGETKEHYQMTRRVEQDIYYLENWSLMFDVRIIFLTVYLAVKGDEKAF
jgi:putative colanic acid biosynthesis UDP-glucose lipid carrier transferase